MISRGRLKTTDIFDSSVEELIRLTFRQFQTLSCREIRGIEGDLIKVRFQRHDNLFDNFFL